MVSSIPPITSLGSNRRKKPARLQGLAHKSLGRYMAEKREKQGFGGGTGSMDGSEAFDASKHFAKKTKNKPKQPTVKYEPKIECISDVIEDYNNDGCMCVVLDFKGIKFLNDTFTKSKNDSIEDKCVYFTPVSFQNKEAQLMLSTEGDILNSEVVSKTNSPSPLFLDEIYIPKLTKTHAPQSMEVKQKNGLTIITYQHLN